MDTPDSNPPDGVLSFEGKAAARHSPWHADIYPIPCHIKSRLDAIPAAWFVCGEDRILAADGGVSPGGEPEAVAALLHGIVEKAANRAGHWPSVLEVRHERVARLLQPLIAERGVEVRVGNDFVGTDAAARVAFMDATGRTDIWPPRSTPMTWAAWGRPPNEIAALFGAAASYARAEPWRNFPWAGAATAIVPGGGRWAAVPTGGFSTTPGLQLYANPDDLHALLTQRAGDRPPRTIATNTILALEFHPPDYLPSPMRREIALAGWEVAEAVAYPVLHAEASPGGGVSAQEFSDLTAILWALARREEAVGKSFPTEPWVDADTGVVLEPRSLSGDSADEDSAWAEDAPVLPGGAQGPKADLAARTKGHSPEQLLGEVFEMGIAFADWLERRYGEAEADKAIRIMEDAVRLLKTLAAQRVPVAAIHESDVRDFLTIYATEMDASMSDDEVAGVLGSLGVLFEYLASEEGIECPWARPIFEGRETYAQMTTAIRLGIKGGEVLDQEALELVLLVSLTYSRQRGFTPGLDLGAGLEWSDEPGPYESALRDSLMATWLLWREEVIAEGVTSPTELVDRLAARREAWAQAPHPDFGKSPVEVVKAERART